MIHLLQKEKYAQVRQLFEEVAINLNCIAVLNHDNDGKVWVDDIHTPSSAFLVDNQYSMYLVGNTANKQFNYGIGEIIKKQIWPIMKPEHGEWVIYFSNPKWNSIFDSDFHLSDYILLKRCFFMLQSQKNPSWKEQIPKDCKMWKIKDILGREELINYKKMMEEIYSQWRSLEEFSKHGFGYVVIKNGTEIISRAMADFVTENKAEMGVWTEEQHRRAGLGTISVAACIEECLQRKITVAWHCSEHNTASQKTAKRAGFLLQKQYTAVLGFFDEYQRFIENSWYKGLYLNQPEIGLKYIKRALKLKPVDQTALSILAILQVKLGRYEGVITTFNKMLLINMENPHQFYYQFCLDPDFESVHGLPRWKLFQQSVFTKYPDLKK
ncbi:GNAT family N-acetyltransferase [Candidatus Lokiarchaeum ossiferum]